MTGQASEKYVADALELQGVTPTEGSAKVIAPALSAQLAATSAAYASMPFETEPSGFVAAVAREKA